MDIQKNDQGKKDLKSTDQQKKKIKYDKGEVTYGHVISEPEFSRKDKSTAHYEAEEVNQKLSHLSLAEDTDPGKRNKNKEKGVRGKNI
ncbi:hypothetical protein [Pedobacter nototheniae]|uniref:hypothetical protein n=1 Tax=Pedobacter nototheniae TaxID=2488994 RepID=UPI00292CB6BD|nr:hypothetical protein [Pedobacter nototheniae]